MDDSLEITMLFNTVRLELLFPGGGGRGRADERQVILFLGAINVEYS